MFYPVILASFVNTRYFETHPISAFFAELLQKTESNPVEFIISKLFLCSLCFKKVGGSDFGASDSGEKARIWLEMALFNNVNQKLEAFSISLLQILIKKSNSKPKNSTQTHRKLDQETLSWIVKSTSLAYYNTHKTNKSKINELFQDICDNRAALKLIAKLKPNVQLTTLPNSHLGTEKNSRKSSQLAQNLVVRLVADVTALKYLQNNGGNIFKQHFHRKKNTKRFPAALLRGLQPKVAGTILERSEEASDVK